MFAGDAVAVLLDYIERFGIDLVVMGTHGRALPQRLLLGSVASEVVRRSPAPVLLVPRKVQPIHDDLVRLLVAMDTSEHARRALEAAVQLAEAVPVEITLFQVLPGLGSAPEQRTAAWYEEPVLTGGEYLDELQAKLAKRGLNVRRAYSAGSAAEEILQYVQNGGFDIVAVGTRSLTGVPRLLWGSVSEYVVQHAHVPVLVTSPSTILLAQASEHRLEKQAF